MLYLQDYIEMQHLFDAYEQSGIRDDVADNYVEALRCNTIEKLYTQHENECQHILIALANKDLSILENCNDMANFMQFYGHQITRTKTFKDLIMSGLRGGKLKDLPLFLKVMDECWWFIAYMLGVNIGNSLYLDRGCDSHCLLVNNTGMPFITSDQPIINVSQSIGGNEVRELKNHECDYYYPISPNVAYMINKSNRFPSGIVSVGKDVVDEMNVKMARNANIHIISNSEESLRPYRKNVGEWLDVVEKN